MLTSLSDDGDANVPSSRTRTHMRTLNDHIPGDHRVLGTDEAIHKTKLSRRCTYYIIYCGCSNSGIPRAHTWRPIWQSSHELSSPRPSTTQPPPPKRKKNDIYFRSPRNTSERDTRYIHICTTALWYYIIVLFARYNKSFPRETSLSTCDGVHHIIIIIIIIRTVRML